MSQFWLNIERFWTLPQKKKKKLIESRQIQNTHWSL